MLLNAQYPRQESSDKNFEVKTNISNWLKKKIMLGLRSDQFDQSC